MTNDLVNVKGMLRSHVPLADSRAIADRLGIPHKLVMRKVKKLLDDHGDEISGGNIVPRDYIDSRGKSRPMYELDEQGAIILITSFTGKAATSVRIAVIKEFFRLRLWITDRGSVADSHNLNRDALREFRLENDKPITGVRWLRACQNQSKLINGVMTGVYKSNPRDYMSDEETEIAKTLYDRDTVMLEMGTLYATRKAMLLKWYAKQGYPLFGRSDIKIAPANVRES